MAIDYLQKILNARVYDVAIESPLDIATTLSARLGNRVLLKREDQQPVFSFKLRGAYNKMARLTRPQLDAGVIAASAGNHAQGVALAAQRLRTVATIVMPVTTPQIKIDAVRVRGAAGNRRVREAGASRDPYHRRRAGRFGRHDAVGRRGTAHQALARRPLRGRRRGQAGRARNIPAGPRIRR